MALSALQRIESLCASLVAANKQPFDLAGLFAGQQKPCCDIYHRLKNKTLLPDDIQKIEAYISVNITTANEGHAIWLRGLFYEHGINRPVQPERAFACYKKAANEQSDFHAMARLGYCYANGVGIKKDVIIGLEYLDRASSHEIAFTVTG